LAFSCRPEGWSGTSFWCYTVAVLCSCPLLTLSPQRLREL
jgi:hypothetical protein